MEMQAISIRSWDLRIAMRNSPGRDLHSIPLEFQILSLFDQCHRPLVWDMVMRSKGLIRRPSNRRRPELDPEAVGEIEEGIELSHLGPRKELP